MKALYITLLLAGCGCSSQQRHRLGLTAENAWGRVAYPPDADEVELVEQRERLKLPPQAYEGPKRTRTVIPSTGDLVSLPPKAFPEYPNPEYTPGDTVDRCNMALACTPGFADMRWPLDDVKKRKVLRRYGIRMDQQPGYIVDHFIPVELCGSDDEENLWPQAYIPWPGAAEKNECEAWLIAQVCAQDSKMAVEDAQLIIQTDWYRCYLRSKEK